MGAAETTGKAKFFKWSAAVGLIGVGFVSGWIAQTKLRFLGEAIVEASVIAKHGDASSNTREQVLESMHKFQAGYADRDPRQIDPFMQRLFPREGEVLLLGTESEEWIHGYDEVKKIIFDNVALYLWTSNTRTIDVPYAQIFIDVGVTAIALPRLIAVGGAVLIALLFWLLMTRTDLGKAIRAVSKERHGSRIVGINVDHIFQSDRPQSFAPAKRELVIEKHYLYLPVKTGGRKVRMKLVDDPSVNETTLDNGSSWCGE